MIDALTVELRASVRGRVVRDHALAPLTTYRLGGPATLFVEPIDSQDVVALAEALRASPSPPPVLALGRGSNLVVSDEGWPGLVVHLGDEFSWCRGGRVAGEVRAGGATPLPQLPNWAARRGLAGLEFMVSIPGSVGGAVRMNAGAHGGAVGDTLAAVRIFDIQALTVMERPAAELELSYRHTSLADGELVLEASFSLTTDSEVEIRRRMEEFRKHRAATQPGALQNAGSVFKNPPGDAAGRLVEAAGLKGFSVGGASVSDIHANFFIASQDATAQDVFDLVSAVRARVGDAFGVVLEPEIRFVGRFARNDEPWI